MSGDKMLVLRGRLDWARVLGTPPLVENKFYKRREWSVDLTPSPEALALLAEHGLDKLSPAGKLREPHKNDSRKERYISFRHPELKKDGEKNDPIRIVDAAGDPWPSDVLIGNGSVADVKCRLVDYGTTTGLYIRAIRVLDHVPYVPQEFAPLSEEDEYFATPEKEASEAKPADAPFEPEMDDDIPF